MRSRYTWQCFYRLSSPVPLAFEEAVKYNEQGKMKKLILGITGLFFLIVSGWVYIAFRPKSILLFDWINLLKIDTSIFQGTHINLPAFFIYNLPNGLFLLFGYLFLYIIWGKDKKYFFYCAVITLLNIIFELLQINVLPGTFDILDLMIIITAFLASPLIYNFGVRYEK
jgi:hypothetical protein